MTPKGLLVLAGTLLTLGAATAWGQKVASNWRIFRDSDGLPESECVSVTLTIQGKVLAKHLNLSFLTELDGYGASTIAADQTGMGRVYQSPGGQLWTVAPDGLLELQDDVWQFHRVGKVAEELQNRPSRAIDPIPLYPVRQGRVVLLLPSCLLEFSVENPDKPRERVLKGAEQTQLGRFSNLSPARDGGLWISGLRGLAKVPGPVRKLSPDTVWSEYIPPESLGIINLQEAHEDEQGGVTTVADSLKGNLRVLVHFDGRNWTVDKAGSEKIRLGWRGPDATRWAATISSLYQIDPGQQELVESEEVSARQFFDLATEPTGVFWLATSEGLFRYTPSLWRCPYPVRRIDTPILCMTIGLEGKLWFISGGGLHAVQEETYQDYAFPPALARDLQNAHSLTSVGKDKLLLEAGGHLFAFDPRGGFSPVLVKDATRRFQILGTLKNGVACVQSQSPGTHDGGFKLETYDGKGFEPFLYPPIERVPGGRFSCLFAAQNGDVWMSGDSGTAYIRDGKWQGVATADAITPESALGFAEAPDGRIWCATRERIWEFDGRNWSPSKSGFDRINALHRGRDGDLWVASNSGLHRFAQKSRTWLENGTEEGLPSASIREICEDSRGRIWAGTTRGVSQYRPEVDADPPQTRIQGSTNKVTVPEGGTLNIVFTGQDKWKHTPRERLLYSWCLDQKEWSAFSEVNSVNLSELSASKHYFQVRAMDRNGNLDPNPALLEFVVVLPWYKEARLLVISITALAVAVFFAGLAFNRHRQLLRSYAEVEQKVTDRTRELEIANRQLLHSQKMTALGTLAAGVAHDFNSILSIIKGSAQIIEDNLNHPEKVRTRVDRIKTVVEQGSGIVKAMLGFSRESGQTPAPCDLNGVVDDTIKLLGERFLREAEVVFEPGANLPLVRASKDFVQQILLNLIFNAAESMAQPKRILVATRYGELPPADMVLAPASATGYVFISVRDSGCGIPPENLQRIFEPFFTTKSMSARRGTGLGLSMAYELAKKLEAGLAVESVVDRGSTFTLVLPWREDQAAVAAASEYEHSHHSDN